MLHDGSGWVPRGTAVPHHLCLLPEIRPLSLRTPLPTGDELHVIGLIRGHIACDLSDQPLCLLVQERLDHRGLLAAPVVLDYLESDAGPILKRFQGLRHAGSSPQAPQKCLWNNHHVPVISVPNAREHQPLKQGEICRFYQMVPACDLGSQTCADPQLWQYITLMQLSSLTRKYLRLLAGACS